MQLTIDTRKPKLMANLIEQALAEAYYTPEQLAQQRGIKVESWRKGHAPKHKDVMIKIGENTYYPKRVMDERES